MITKTAVITSANEDQNKYFLRKLFYSIVYAEVVAVGIKTLIP